MKKILYIIASAILVAASVVSCQKPVLVTGVTLDSSSLTMIVGESDTLVATVSPADADNTNVIWSSSNASVAKVENGRVSAISAGTAQVSVKTDDGCFTDACTVTVYEKEILPTGIKLDGSKLSLLEGESVQLTATVSPDNSTDKSVAWTTSDKEVAVVTDGVVTALKAGEAEITATTCNGIEAKCAVTVSCNVSGVALDYPAISLEEGQTQQLTAKVYPSRATDTAVSWKSSDPAVAEVSDAGLVKALKAGTAVVTVKTKDGDFTDECTVTVTSRVASLELDKTQMSVFVGESDELKATVKPANASNPEINWYSEDESVATVSSEGEVKGVKAGKTTICATTVDGGKHASCDAVVYNHVAFITLDTEELTLFVGGVSAELVATVLPEDAPDRSVKWTSSDSKVAAVDASGKVSPVGVGEALITATTNDQGLTASCKVTVQKIVLVSSITLNETSARVELGTTLQLEAAVAPEDATDKSLTWTSSDAAVASVGDNGLVTARKVGKATITAKANDASGKTATCEVSVVVPVTEVKFAQSSVTVEKGKPYTLEATVLPEHATVKTLEWSSSDTDVATVDSKGAVTGRKNGTATITARSTDSGVSAECKVTVVTKVGSISLSPTALQLMVGGSGKVVATVTPEDATDKSLTWSSSDATVASVDQSGNVTAKKAGKATITVKANDGSGKTASCTVSVGVPVSEVTLNMTTLNLGRGETETITATVKPDNATDKTITWKSSDPSVATVDANGLVKGIKDGEATVTATNEASGKSAGCTVYVVAKVTEIKVDPAEATIKEGETVRINATALPVDAKDRGLKYQSMKTSVATVSADGVVTGVSEGTAQIKITAKDGYGAQAYFKVEVLPDVVPVESITFNTTSLSMKIGESQTIIATVKPSDQKTAPLKWTSSNPNVASVDDNGKVTAIASGRCEIKAYADDSSGKSATCSVTVLEPVKVRSITLDKTNETMVKGSTLTIAATVQPADAANPELKWTSSAPYVASVSSTGEVTAEGEGTATITAAATDGSGVTATCKITVVSELVRVTGIEWINNPPKVLNVGDQVNYAPYIRINPSNATDKAIIWQVQQGGVMVHDGSVYTAVKTGPCNVIAKTHDGDYSCSITVNVKSVPVTGVSISKDAISLKKGESMQLTATVHPDNATNKNVSWGTSDSDVATVSSAGVVNARGKGTATITVKTSDGSKTATCKVTVYGEPGAGESEGVGFEDL